MIKFVEWLLGRAHTERLHDERKQAEEDVKVSRVLRSNAERIGPELRRRLAANHFGEDMAAALHQRGWTRE